MNRSWLWVAAAAALTCAPTGFAANIYWQVDSGSWYDVLNWTIRVPTFQDTARITNGGTAVIEGKVGQCDDLVLSEGGTMQLRSGGLETLNWDRIGDRGNGVLSQTGGTHTAKGLELGCSISAHGVYELTGNAELRADSEDVGSGGTGEFTQSSGTNSVGELSVGVADTAVGTYELSGDAELTASTVYVGESGTGTFLQTGGTNSVSSKLYLAYRAGSTGTYILHDGHLIAANESIGASDRPATFMQTGGTNAVGYLSVGTAGRYAMSGGTLTITDSGFVQGIIDFASGTPSVDFGGLVDLTQATILAGEDVVVTVAPDSLLMVPAGFDPETGFGSITGNGLVHRRGSTLVIAPGEAVTGTGTIDDPVHCGGTITAMGSVNLLGGVRITPGGSVTLGSGTLTVDNHVSEIRDGQLAADKVTVGVSGTGALRQYGGVHTTRYLTLGDETGAEGTYELSEDGQLSNWWEIIGDSGTGTLTQASGTNRVQSDLIVGSSGHAMGEYRQTGGTVAVGDDLYVGYRDQASGTYTQTGGLVTVGDELHLGSRDTASGAYTLSGDGRLLARGELIGYGGEGTFTQTGGINRVSGSLRIAARGTYKLADDGQLVVAQEYLYSGSSGSALTQTGGTNTVGHLVVGKGVRYELSGGVLTITEGAEFAPESTLDFAGGVATANLGGLVRLNDATIRQSQMASVTVAPDSLLILPTGFDPVVGFGSFINFGFVHHAGAPLTVGPDQGFTGEGTIEDFVHCEGTINTGGKLSLRAGLMVAGEGRVNLGTGTLTTDDETSGMSGGQLAAGYEFVGHGGTGRFSQTGGTNTITGGLYLASGSDSEGTYELSGDGQLVAGVERVGDGGTGTFIHAGGTNTTGHLYFRTDKSRYMLSHAGQLLATEEDIAAGKFIQTGGTHAVDGTLRVSGGAFELGSDGHLTAGTEHIGTFSKAAGTFTQRGGTNTVGYLSIENTGHYELGGGAMAITDSALVTGSLMLAGGTASLGGLVDLGAAALTTTSSTAVTVAPNSLLILPAGFDPTVEFGSFTNQGLVQHMGTPLTVGAGEGLTGRGTISGHIYCVGTITAVDAIDLIGGVTIGSGGAITLGEGILTVDNDTGEINQGQFAAAATTIGHNATAEMTQTGGVHTLTGDLTLGTNPAATGNYTLTGDGQLVAARELVGSQGTGTFVQTGGTNMAEDLYVSNSGSLYELGGDGRLTAEYESVRSGIVDQTGGTNTVGTLSIGADDSGATGKYKLSGTGQLIARDEYVGDRGTGRLKQTGGTNLVSGSIYLGHRNGTGLYSFFDGFLVAANKYVGYNGSGLVKQTGGTSAIDLLYLGYEAGTDGTYQLIGEGVLLAGEAYIGRQGAGRFEQTSGTVIVDRNLYLGHAFDSTGAYELSGAGRLAAREEFVGYGDDGMFSQTGGIHTVDWGLYVGYGAYVRGTYELSGNGELTAPAQSVGYSGAGTFRQSGGRNRVELDLYLGHRAGADGTYELAGDGQLATTAEYVGHEGRGAFVQTGGMNTVDWNLYVGYAGGSIGTYTLSDTGQLAARGQHIGHSGTATMTQTGGTNNVSGPLYLGYTRGADGTYALSGSGQLTAVAEYVGHDGTGTFAQAGGTNAVSDRLFVGYHPGSKGAYTLAGDGRLTTGNAYIGYSGSGTVEQRGGTHSVSDDLYLGYEVGGVGEYALDDDGRLGARHEYIGHAGVGTLTQTGGTNSVAGDLYLAYDEYATGAYTQTGGTNVITGDLFVGYDQLTSGTYTLGGAGNLTVGGTAFIRHDRFARGTLTVSDTAGVHITGDLHIGGSGSDLSRHGTLALIGSDVSMEVRGELLVDYYSALTWASDAGGVSPLQVHGDVDLAWAQLVLSLAEGSLYKEHPYYPEPAATDIAVLHDLLLVDNLGPNPVAGRLRFPRPDGAQYLEEGVVLDPGGATLGGVPYYITYQGGDGNDIVLKRAFVGDANGNEVVDGHDIDPFVEALLSGTYQVNADMNGDRALNGLDVDLFVDAVIGTTGTSAAGAVAVPEPSGFVLMMVGLIALGACCSPRQMQLATSGSAARDLCSTCSFVHLFISQAANELNGVA